MGEFVLVAEEEEYFCNAIRLLDKRAQTDLFVECSEHRIVTVGGENDEWQVVQDADAVVAEAIRGLEDPAGTNEKLPKTNVKRKQKQRVRFESSSESEEDDAVVSPELAGLRPAECQKTISLKSGSKVVEITPTGLTRTKAVETTPVDSEKAKTVETTPVEVVETTPTALNGKNQNEKKVTLTEKELESLVKSGQLGRERVLRSKKRLQYAALGKKNEVQLDEYKEPKSHYLHSGETQLEDGLYVVDEDYIFVNKNKFFTDSLQIGADGETFMAVLVKSEDDENEQSLTEEEVEAGLEKATGSGFNARHELERRFGSQHLREAWQSEYDKHVEREAFMPPSDEYLAHYTAEGNLKPLVKTLYKQKKKEDGTTFVKARFVILWHVVQRHRNASTYFLMRPSGSTPTNETVRLLTVNAVLTGAELEVVDETSAFISTSFNWRTESAGGNLKLSEQTPFPVMSIEGPDGRTVPTVLTGNVNGVRSGPEEYSKIRDQRCSEAGLQRCAVEPTLKMGAYPTPTNKNYNECDDPIHTSYIPTRRYPEYPYSRVRTCMSQHVDDSVLKRGVNWDAEWELWSKTSLLHEGNRVSSEVDTKEYGKVQLTTVEFRGIEITYSHNPPFLVHSQLQYQYEKYGKIADTKKVKVPVKASFDDELLQAALTDEPSPRSLKTKQVKCGSALYLKATGPHLNFPLRKLASAPPYKCTVAALKEMESYIATHPFILDLTPLGTTDSDFEGHRSIVRPILESLYDASFGSQCQAGRLTLYRGSLISEQSWRINVKCTSTAESELQAACGALKGHESVRHILESMGEARVVEGVLPSGVPGAFEVLRGDNNASQGVLAGAGTRRVRATVTSSSYVSETAQTKHRRFLSRVTTDDNLADIFTKILPRERFHYLSSGLGVYKWDQKLPPISDLKKVNAFIGEHYEAIRKFRSEQIVQRSDDIHQWLPSSLLEYGN